MSIAETRIVYMVLTKRRIDPGGEFQHYDVARRIRPRSAWARICMKTLIAMAALTLTISTAVQAQTRSVREAATTYGARLTAKGQPANLNVNRINNRVISRVDSRLSLRIERYRPDTASNPTAAYQKPLDDQSRAAPRIQPIQQQSGE